MGGGACYARAPFSVGTDFEFRSESRASWFPSFHLDARHVLSDSSLTWTYNVRLRYMPNDSYYNASRYKYRVIEKDGRDLKPL